MNEPLDEQYLKWLYSQVANVRLKNPATTYWSLMRLLYTTEFVWLIPNDDNRVEDGRNLRYEFLDHHRDVKADQEWLGLGCSFLEMLIALSRRLQFEAGGTIRDWFWHFVKTLLQESDDLHFDEPSAKQAVDGVIWRTYRPNGDGGLFPLKHYLEDQRRVELWYQMSAYLEQRG